MKESPSSISLPTGFLAESERLLTPFYAECFTDETRKVRNLLLVTSSVLILFALSVVAVDDAVKLSPLPLYITVRTGLRWILMALCGYFLPILAARSYIEWRLWRLRHAAAAAGIADSQTKTLTSYVELHNSANAKLASSLRAFRKENERLSTTELVEVAPLQKRRDGLWEQSEQLFFEMKRKRAQAEATGHWDEHRDLGNHWEELHEEINELDRRLHDDERKKQWMEEREALGRQLDEANKEHHRQVTGHEVQVLEAELAYIGHNVCPLRPIINIRRGLEMFFPILFGLLALLLAFVVRGTG